MEKLKTLHGCLPISFRIFCFWLLLWQEQRVVECLYPKKDLKLAVTFSSATSSTGLYSMLPASMLAAEKFLENPSHIGNIRSVKQNSRIRIICQHLINKIHYYSVPCISVILKLLLNFVPLK